jgi:hypothetical protein
MKDSIKIIKECCDGDNRHEWAKYIDVDLLNKWYGEIGKKLKLIRERDEDVQCLHCGEYLNLEYDNVGFREQPHIEIIATCPNGCDL